MTMSSSQSPLQALSPEHLLTISTYLPTSDVWSLASINTVTHSTLLNSQGALREIWIHTFQDKFPAVFDQQQRLNSSVLFSASDANIDTADRGGRRHEPTDKKKTKVVLVDRLNNQPTSSTAASNTIYGYGEDGDKNGEELNHHLPQLSNLLPASYPQSIDYTQVPSKESFCILSLSGIQDDGESLPLPLLNAAKVAYHDDQVPLIKFTGKVGHGDRSIRSDAAFPSRVRYVPSPTLSSSSRLYEQQSGRRSSLRRFLGLGSREKGSKWTTSWKRFTSTSALQKDAKHIETDASSSSVVSESTLGCSFQSDSTLETLHLSSDRSTTPTSIMLTRDLISGVLDSNQDDGGDITKGLKKMNRLTKNDRIACPFVIPTVVSQQKDATVVDVTPRHVAYYEVTILNEQAKESSSGEVLQQQGDEDRQLHGEENCQEAYTQEDSRSGCISVGLSTLSSKLESNMPGWDEHSYGYHGDDGRTFHLGKRSTDEMALPVFGRGDTIGCGIDYRSSGGQIFFVKNGSLLKNSFHSIGKKVLRKGLYPTLGIDSNCPIHVNFGQVPFKFDLGSFSVEKRCMRS